MSSMIRFFSCSKRLTSVHLFKWLKIFKKKKPALFCNPLFIAVYYWNEMDTILKGPVLIL